MPTFLIKRNLRKESPESWLAIAQEYGICHEERLGKDYSGDIYIDKGIGVPLRIVFKVTERTIDAKGQYLLFPEIEVDTYYTSLPDAPAQVIDLYEQHGTSEQFHSEIKGELDLERLPSVIQNLITIASKIVYHARHYKLAFGRRCPWFATFKRIYTAFNTS